MSQQISEEKVDQDIPIFFAANKNYLPHMAVSCISILEHTSSVINFHFLIAKDVSEKDCNKFETEIKKVFPHKTQYSIHFHRLYEHYNFSKFNTPEQWTEVTNYRLAIPLLFQQYKKVIYLDCDVLLNGDIKEFFDIEMEQNLLAGVPEPHWRSLYEANILVENKPFRDYYKELIDYRKFINAGVLLFNLEQICKEENYYMKFVKILANPQPRINGPDQDFLNLSFQGRIKILPERYNWMVSSFFSDDRPIDNFLILHCLYKPWKCSQYSFKPSCGIYWDILGKTNYYTHVRADFLVMQLRASLNLSKEKYSRIYIYIYITE